MAERCWVADAWPASLRLGIVLCMTWYIRLLGWGLGDVVRCEGPARSSKSGSKPLHSVALQQRLEILYSFVAAAVAVK